ncbi:short chain dehydrogenase/reductase [Desulfosarcina variabilis str. Montpellier]|uniref:SDR family oxidoreductase n=1 Tax=Desulfosarcina variabilis TaxID=2300 RepID=UPI003AFA7536
MDTFSQFNLDGKVAIITGAAGLLGPEHASALAEAGANLILSDLKEKELKAVSAKLSQAYPVEVMGVSADVTCYASIEKMKEIVCSRFGRIDILINNAANNPSFDAASEAHFSRFENFPDAMWQKDIDVGLTGAFNCCKAFGCYMAENGGGVILNIASDLSIIAPDQRIYQDPKKSCDDQLVKPVTYSVVKHGIVGLTKYLATYWCQKNVRVNCISPGGVFNNQDSQFVSRLTNLIPMGRMAGRTEYKAAILFMTSSASSYMTGSNIVIDGGRTVW